MCAYIFYIVIQAPSCAPMTDEFPGTCLIHAPAPPDADQPAAPEPSAVAAPVPAALLEATGAAATGTLPPCAAPCPAEAGAGLLSRLGLYFTVRHTARSMRTFADAFERDYDCVAVFLTVAETCLQAVFHLAPAEPAEDGLESAYLDHARSGLPLIAISELTGIPRETVRRKVRKLVDMGFLAACADGRVYLPPSIFAGGDMARRFAVQLAETDQLVRAISFYEARPER